MAAEACTFENFWGESLVQYLPRLFRSTVEHARRLAARRTVGRRLLSSSSLQLVPLQLVLPAARRNRSWSSSWPPHTSLQQNENSGELLGITYSSKS